MTDIAAFCSILEKSPLLAPILDQWTKIQLPNAWLVAGAVAQTVWNENHRYEPEFGIKDIDIVYFDAGELTSEAEAAEENRIASLFPNVRASFDVKNEARVHLWYEASFGIEINPYQSSEEAIATFPTISTSIGVRENGGEIEVCAPYGLQDLMCQIVRPNRTLVTRQVYDKKAARWKRLWPKLDIRAWDDG